jgi:hypothetical protein
MDNTAVVEKRKWTAEEFATFKATGEFPEWHKKHQAPDHSTSKRLCKSSVRLKYEKFVANNPWFVDEVARLARMVKASGLKQWGIKAAIEVIRFNYLVGYSDSIVVQGEPRRIAINNLIAPYLAREVMRLYPDLAGFFETRELSHEE